MKYRNVREKLLCVRCVEKRIVVLCLELARWAFFYTVSNKEEKEFS